MIKKNNFAQFLHYREFVNIHSVLSSGQFILRATISHRQHGTFIHVLVLKNKTFNNLLPLNSLSVPSLLGVAGDSKETLQETL